MVPPCARDAGLRMVRHLGERQKTMTAPRPRTWQPKQLDAGILQAEISSFRLRLAAEGKAAKTIRTYTEAVQWFAAAHLLGQTRRARQIRLPGHLESSEHSHHPKEPDSASVDYPQIEEYSSNNG